MPLSIRPARVEDGPRLQAIEVDAGERFRTVGLGSVADHEPFSLEELEAYRRSGRSWVAEHDGVVVGYLVADRHRNAVHLEQVSVAPDAQGRGVGRALVEHLGRWAVAEGYRTITLTTFRDVAWNAPLYGHLGFVEIASEELDEGLRAIRDDEAAHGLDPDRRVCMRWDLADRLRA